MTNQATKAEIADRRKKVAANLLAGLNITQIADALGVNKSTISRDAAALHSEWKECRGKDTAALVELENARLDRILNAVWKKAIDGDLLAIDRIIKVMDRRAKLLGLDKPTRVDTLDLSSVPDEMLDRYEETGDPTEIRELLTRV
jgi:hypothetical protein